MACGTPVVASAVGGIPEQLSDGQEGFLCPSGDAAALAARLLDLLRDPARRADCAAAALRRAQDYDVRTQVSRFLEWYDALVQARRSPGSPPPPAWISTREAPASSAFSTSSLMALAGRSTTSPAAMRLTVSGGRRRMGM